jgi:hypothetical protein
VTFTTRRDKCPPVHINDVKYLGLDLDAALPGTHTFLLNVNSSDSRSPTCSGYSGASPNSLPTTQLLIYKVILKPIWTYGIQFWGTTSNSNIKILERFQSKVLRLIVDAPWYVSNSVIRKDPQIPTVKEKISRFRSHYDVRINVQPNELIESLTEPPIHRRLSRNFPNNQQLFIQMHTKIN